MELTDSLYTKLFKYAKWVSKDEDVAANAITKIFMKAHLYTGSCTQDWYTWSNTIIHNCARDNWRKKKLIKEHTQPEWFFVELLDESDKQKKIVEDLREYATDQELQWLLDYHADKYTQDNTANKLKAFRLIQKIRTRMSGKPIITKRNKVKVENTKTGEVKLYPTIKAAADDFNMTREYFDFCISNEKLITKTFKISKINDR